MITTRETTGNPNPKERLLVDKLFEDIIPEKCKFIQKKNEIRLIMIKKEEGEWDSLYYKPSAQKTIKQNVRQ